MAATATVTFTATLRNVKYCSHLYITSEQKQNGYCGFRTPLDHPFLALAVLCHCRRSTNSTSKTLLRCFAPAMPTQEPRITVSIAFLVVAIGSASFSRCDSLPSSSTSILGCSPKSLSRCMHLESKASGRRTCVSCGGTWGRFILIGNRTATYSISECQKICSGISARHMASILRKPLPNCDDHLSQQRGLPLSCTG